MTIVDITLQSPLVIAYLQTELIIVSEPQTINHNQQLFGKINPAYHLVDLSAKLTLVCEHLFATLRSKTPDVLVVDILLLCWMKTLNKSQTVDFFTLNTEDPITLYQVDMYFHSRTRIAINYWITQTYQRRKAKDEKLEDLALPKSASKHN